METQSPLPSLGIFTTDRKLRVRTWDDWLASATGKPAESVYNQPLDQVISDLESRGLHRKFNQVLNQGTVEVLAPAFHRYLIPCPPSAPSRWQHMRQRVTIMPLRDDERISGTLVSIEDVTVRLETETLSSDRKIPPQKTAPGSETAPLVQVLKDTNWRVRKEAAGALIEHGGPVAIAALLRTLEKEHENFGALNSALEVLSLSRIDVIPPLLELLKDTRGDLHIYLVQLLGDKGDERAVPALLKAISDPDANVCYHAVESLGKLKAPEAVEPLMAIVISEDFYLSFPAIDALKRIGDARVAPRLVPLLKNDLLRTPVSELLGDLGDEAVVSPLAALLKAPGTHVPVVCQALSALRDRYVRLYDEGDHISDRVADSIGAAGTKNLLDTLPEVRDLDISALATVLGWLKGPAVERALTRLLGHPRARREVVEALVRHGGRVTSLLTGQLDSEDLDVRFAATVALGRIGDARAVPALVNSLNSDPENIIVAAGAIAKIGDRTAYQSLLPLLGHEKATVRQAVISALNSIGHPHMAEDIKGLMDHEDPRIRESAVKITGYFGFPHCIPVLLERTDDPEEAVRQAAVSHLPYLEQDRADQRLMQALSDDTPKVRAAAATAMAHLDREKARKPLLRALDDPDPWVRFFAARSMGKHRFSRIRERLESMAEADGAPQVRIECVKALGLINQPDVVPFISRFVTHEDPDMARAAVEALGSVGHPHATPALVRAIRAPDADLRMAVIEILGKAPGSETIEILQWVAASEKVDEVADAAAGALCTLASPEAVSALVNLLADPGRREMAVSALSRLGEDAMGSLAKHLSNPALEIKRAILDALTRMKRPAASHYLIDALADPSGPVRLLAIRGLIKLGNREARPRILTMAQNDPETSVRQEAKKALKTL